MQATIAASILFSLLSATAFLLVGRTVLRRSVSPDLRLPRDAFGAFWVALGATTVFGAAMTAAARWLDPGLELFVTLNLVTLLILCVGLWGLLFYLVFLYTDSRRAALPLAVGYLAFFGCLVYYVLSSRPVGVQLGRWGVELEYARPIDSGPLYIAVILFLVLPQVLAGFAYLSLYPRVADPLQKRRILIVSLSIILWFATGFALASPELRRSDEWQLASRMIGLAATAAIYYAYAILRPGQGGPAPSEASAGQAAAEGAELPQRRKAMAVA